MINSKRVREIVINCTPEDNYEDDTVIVSGVMHTNHFSVEYLNDHKEEIANMIYGLDAKFHDGWSFLNMPFDRIGVQWGEQYEADQLLTLGLALGLMKFCLPEEYWEVLPGGVPYVQVIK